MGWNLENLWLEARDKVIRPTLGAAVSIKSGGIIPPTVFTQRKSGGQSYLPKQRSSRQLGPETGHSGYISQQIADANNRYANSIIEYPGYTPPIVPPDDTWLPNIKVNVPYLGEMEIKDALEIWDKLTAKAADAYYGNTGKAGKSGKTGAKTDEGSATPKDNNVKLTRRGEYIPAARRRRQKREK